MSARKSSLTIQSMDELSARESEILTRINEIENGANLFLINPFLLLADVGVGLGSELQAQLIREQPYLSGLSDVAYKALKGSKLRQKIRVDLGGLFLRKSK